MTVKSPLSEATIEELLHELQSRPGVVASVWGVEDALGAFDNDEDAADLTDAQMEAAGTAFLSLVGDGLNDILGERGNTYLSDRWSEHKDEILAEVRSAPTP